MRARQYANFAGNLAEIIKAPAVESLSFEQQFPDRLLFDLAKQALDHGLFIHGLFIRIFRCFAVLGKRILEQLFYSIFSLLLVGD